MLVNPNIISGINNKGICPNIIDFSRNSFLPFLTIDGKTTVVAIYKTSKAIEPKADRMSIFIKEETRLQIVNKRKIVNNNRLILIVFTL